MFGDILSHRKKIESGIESLKKKLEIMKAALEKNTENLEAVASDQFLIKRANKPFGAITINFGGVFITQTVEKKVDWDQDVLANVAHRISSHGDNPEKYMKITYSVPEKSFSTFPTEVQAFIGGARTIKPGKTKYVLKDKNEK